VHINLCCVPGWYSCGNVAMPMLWHLFFRECKRSSVQDCRGLLSSAAVVSILRRGCLQAFRSSGSPIVYCTDAVLCSCEKMWSLLLCPVPVKEGGEITSPTAARSFLFLIPEADVCRSASFSSSAVGQHYDAAYLCGEAADGSPLRSSMQHT
jgi:hypothetical protein